MRYLFLLICFILSVSAANAQKKLTITYESSPIVPDSLRSGHWFKICLVVRDSVSYEFPLFNNSKNKNRKPLGTNFQVHSIYKNYSSKRLIFQSQPFQKPKYCVNDTLKSISWDLMGGEKFILGYSCQKASAIINSNEVEVFYTPQLPTMVGPFSYWGLPGAILEVWQVGTSDIIKAIAISLTAEEIVEPDKGRKISRMEFDKIINEINSSRTIIRTN